jgi:hypothetical protein
MTPTHSLLLYVADPAASARHYARMLDRDPLEASPTFVAFLLAPGLVLGLWRRDGVTPAPEVAGGGGELGLKLADPAAVDACHADWLAKGLPIVLPPTDLDFGRSFVAVDLDGHRTRVYALADEG